MATAPHQADGVILVQAVMHKKGEVRRRTTLLKNAVLWVLSRPWNLRVQKKSFLMNSNLVGKIIDFLMPL